MRERNAGLHLVVEALGVKHSGGATILRDLLASAAADGRFERISVFCSPRASRNFDIERTAKVDPIECPLAERNRLFRLWWLKDRLAREVKRRHADALLCLGGIGSVPPCVPLINYIQQSLPFFREVWPLFSWRGRLRLKVILKAVRRTSRRSRVVIVQTPTMRRRVCERFGIPERNIEVVAPVTTDLPASGSPSEQLAAMRAVAPERRLLYVGSLAAYKNTGLLVRSMEELCRRVPGLTLFLTCPPDHPHCRAEGVVGLGYLQRTVLREAYELATVLVMPSLVETVGLPMLEAMQVGTPVLAADRPYAHDVCEDAAVFFDPLNAGDFVGKVRALLGDEGLRSTLVGRGLDLIRKRRSEKPYERMLDIVTNAAAGRGQRELS